MRKKIVLSIIICLLGATLLLVVKTIYRIEDRKQIAKNISHLPDLTIAKTDSTGLLLDSIVNNKPLVLIAFNTTCDICQHEIKDILDNIIRFDKVKIVMISSEPMDSIIKFQKKYELNKYSRIFLGQVDDVYANQKLGIDIIPQIFIYGSDKRLIKVYKGETKLDAILKYLN